MGKFLLVGHTYVETLLQFNNVMQVLIKEKKG